MIALHDAHVGGIDPVLPKALERLVDQVEHRRDKGDAVLLGERASHDMGRQHGLAEPGRRLQHRTLVPGPERLPQHREGLLLKRKQLEQGAHWTHPLSKPFSSFGLPYTYLS